MLMLDLTDGDQTVKGMEYQAIKELHSDLTPGTKVYIHYIYIIHIYMYTCIIKFQSAFGLGQKFENMFVGKVRTITRPGTLVLLFLKAVYL